MTGPLGSYCLTERRDEVRYLGVSTVVVDLRPTVSLPDAVLDFGRVDVDAQFGERRGGTVER